MPPATDGDIAVVKPYYAVEDAYGLGYDEFEDAEVPEGEDPDLEGYHSSARYANTILPRLRAMAGHGDAGHGTYQQGRQVAAIHPGAEEDRPAEATLTEARHVFDVLIEAFQMGVHDAISGTERDPPEGLWSV